jgi:hypothetical protein
MDAAFQLQGPSPPIDVIVSKRVVGASTATLGSGDLPTFNFEVKLTAAAGTTVPNPTLIDTMSPAGLAIQGTIGASNGEHFGGAVALVQAKTPTHYCLAVVNEMPNPGVLNSPAVRSLRSATATHHSVLRF